MQGLLELGRKFMVGAVSRAVEEFLVHKFIRQLLTRQTPDFGKMMDLAFRFKMPGIATKCMWYFAALDDGYNTAILDLNWAQNDAVVETLKAMANIRQEREYLRKICFGSFCGCCGYDWCSSRSPHPSSGGHCYKCALAVGSQTIKGVETKSQGLQKASKAVRDVVEKFYT